MCFGEIFKKNTQNICDIQNIKISCVFYDQDVEQCN